MDLSLSVTVMAHPQRADFIASLTEKLGNVPVVWDEWPAPGLDDTRLS